MRPKVTVEIQEAEHADPSESRQVLDRRGQTLACRVGGRHNSVFQLGQCWPPSALLVVTLPQSNNGSTSTGTRAASLTGRLDPRLRSALSLDGRPDV